MTDFGAFLVDRIHSMKVGDHMRIGRHEMNEAFGAGMFEGFIDQCDGPHDRLMGRLMGSAWGEFKLTEDIESGDTIVSRHEPGDKRVWQYPDRRF